MGGREKRKDGANVCAANRMADTIDSTNHSPYAKRN